MNQLSKKASSLKLARKLHSAYMVSPKTSAIEQEKQAGFLTKTLVREEAPSNVGFQNETERDTLIGSIRNAIIETMYFHRDEGLKFPKRMRERTRAYKLAQYKSRMSSKVLMNLLTTIWSSPASRNPDIMDTHISYRPDLVAPWQRNSDKIQVSGKVGHLINGRKLITPFAERAVVGSTLNEDIIWDEVTSPFFDIHQMESVFKPNRGFYSDSPFPCPQKMMALNNHFWTPTMHFGQGIFYCFAHAMAYALDNGAKMGDDFLDPVPMQYFSFNGTSLYFVWFQLNTLNFNEDTSTVKNLAWRQELKLYDNVTEIVEKKAEGPTDYNEYTGKRMSLVDFNRSKLAETLDNEQTVRVGIYGYNQEAASRFVDFMLYS